MNDTGDAPIPTMAELWELVKTQRDQILDLQQTIATLQNDTVFSPLVEEGFVAIGPDGGTPTQAQLQRDPAGFRVWGSAGFRVGVVGIGTSDFALQGNQSPLAQPIGVYGHTSFGLDEGPGIGVLGRATAQPGQENTVGVRGEGINGAPGVVGTSIFLVGADEVLGKGPGVQGFSGDGPGVTGWGRIGVVGTGSFIAIQGGEPLDASPGQTKPDIVARMYIGVVGQGPTDGSGNSYSYGGWFAPIDGTAALHLEPSPNAAPPQDALRGDLFVDSTGGLWFCTTGTNPANGNPATWTQLA